MKELSHYQERWYTDLVSIINEEIICERKGRDGAEYQIEILVMWDSKPNGVIRVIGSIDDGGWHAFVPLTESILIYPDY